MWTAFPPSDYYEVIRLLTDLRFALSFQNLVTLLPLRAESVRPPRYTCIIFMRSPRSIDPGGISPPLRFRSVLTACCIEDYIGFRSLLITGLNRFTLSHCGSRTPCPTLKPHLTASAPRTRYRLFAKLYRVGAFTQLYYTHRTGARSDDSIITFL